ncbi:MAG: hypothetical protein ACI8W8_004616 [Rhodothermales bacterium]|jgi:hypothetical protein
MNPLVVAMRFLMCGLAGLAIGVPLMILFALLTFLIQSVRHGNDLPVIGFMHQPVTGFAVGFLAGAILGFFRIAMVSAMFRRENRTPPTGLTCLIGNDPLSLGISAFVGLGTLGTFGFIIGRIGPLLADAGGDDASVLLGYVLGFIGGAAGFCIGIVLAMQRRSLERSRRSARTPQVPDIDY